MSIQSFQRGYFDKLAQFAGATNLLGTVTDAYGRRRPVIPAGSNPDPSEVRGNTNKAQVSGGPGDSGSLVVPEENLPVGEVPAVVEPLDGDRSEWDGVKGPVYHTVQPGDVLGRIAKEFGIPIKKIQELNGLSDPNKIRAGARLRVR